jgi:hypothetical protein
MPKQTEKYFKSLVLKKILSKGRKCKTQLTHLCTVRTPDAGVRVGSNLQTGVLGLSKEKL